jgi:Fur family ferric uptake transcriptional regulator
MPAGRELRMTPSRRAILEEVRSSRSHPTAEDVHAAIRRRLPRVGLGTVYRNLDVLCQHGLVRVISDAGHQRRYDAWSSEHHHVRCEMCGRIDDVVLDRDARLEEWVDGSSGYDIHGYRLCFVGVCPKCAGRSFGAERKKEGGVHGAQGHEDREESADGVRG